MLTAKLRSILSEGEELILGAGELGSGVRNLVKYTRFYSGSASDMVEEDIDRCVVQLTGSSDVI